ncbi:hypothetical protein QUF54_03330 [Candidatus Marithioploca araucensis]|uniref:Uncharacterized protein n=1 Tax=Candidatus Marithioploca araucensis TaxID=70273 RepID=A0ABT7VSP3_9GAMM|nr:hypothetical protein [Candidatus Marithioploca araucensis]
MDIAIPCVTYLGTQYSVNLDFVDDNLPMNWVLNPNVTPSSCEWNNKTSVTATETMGLALPQFQIEETNYTGALDFQPTPTGDRRGW